MKRADKRSVVFCIPEFDERPDQNGYQDGESGNRPACNDP
jgi:hypothetical protein